MVLYLSDFISKEMRRELLDFDQYIKDGSNIEHRPLLFFLKAYADVMEI